MAYFSLNVNTNALVLVLVVPNLSHVTPTHELAECVYGVGTCEHHIKLVVHRPTFFDLFKKLYICFRKPLALLVELFSLEQNQYLL